MVFFLWHQFNEKNRQKSKPNLKSVYSSMLRGFLRIRVQKTPRLVEIFHKNDNSI